MGTYPELSGKMAIVTGATAGIGKSIARCLAQEGVDVAAVGRDRERGQAMETMLQELDTNSFFVRCEVTIPEEIEAAYSEVVHRFGRVDILINCAGGFSKRGRVSDYTLADWEDVVNSNLRSAFLFTRLVLPGMAERRWGRIVNISSTAGQAVPYLTSAIYAAAKAGMLGLTRHVAAEVAQFGVTVNATAPGMTLSERALRNLTPERIAERSKLIPLGRPGETEEQAGIVVFLCSDKAAYITGATVNVNGGAVII